MCVLLVTAPLLTSHLCYFLSHPPPPPPHSFPTRRSSDLLPPTAATSTSSRPNRPSFHLSSSHPEVGSSRHESFFCPGVNLVPRPNRDYTPIVLNVCSLTHRESAS